MKEPLAMPRKPLTRGQKAAATRAANQAAKQQQVVSDQRADTPKSTADQRETQRISLEQSSYRPFAGDHMGTHPMPEGKPSGRRLVVMHGAVGPHPKGSTIYESHVGDVSRLSELLRGGALVWAGDDELDDDDREDLTPEQTGFAPEPTLNEAAFSESPPTLPRTDGIDVDDEAVQEALSAGVGTSGPRSEEDAQEEQSTDESTDESSTE